MIVLIKNLIFQPLAVAFLVSFLATPLTIRFAWKLGLVDDPKKRQHPAHLYQKVIPRAGGLPIFLGLLAASLLFLPFDQHLRGILAGAALVVSVGLFDDKYDLNPYWRLGLCFLSASLVVAAGIGIAFITNPFGGIIRLDQPQLQFYLLGEGRSIWILADLLALFWIVFLMQAVNWSKGFDGQLSGIVIIAALTIAAFSFRYSADITQWPIAVLASALAGAHLGFLPFNFYPQKIMPGYSGGVLSGFLIAVLTILSTSKILTSMVVLGVPLADAAYSMLRRVAAGRSPVWGDRGHLHHKILDEWKWSKRRAAIFYWLVTAVLGSLALCLSSRHKFYAIIMLLVAIGGLLLWFNFLKSWLGLSGRDKLTKFKNKPDFL